jgi:hypothetical protein
MSMAAINTGNMSNDHRLHAPQGWRRCAWPHAAAVALASALVACGGGGGGDSPEPNPPALALPAGKVSGASPVAVACTGGGSATGTVYVNAEVEPMLARAPGDPQLMLAAWQQDRWSDGAARALVSAVSRDGGSTWTPQLHPLSRCGGASAGSPGDFERSTDPWVDVGSDGTLHLMGLSLDGTPFASRSRSAMLATRSTDGGRSWSTPQTLVLDGATRFNDKNTLTVDTLDPRFVYAVWDRLDPAGNGPVLLARSTDAGASWEAAREIHVPPAPAGGTAQTIGNRIVVVAAGPHRGTLVNVFVQIEVSAGRTLNTVRVLRSSDRGLSWGGSVLVAEHRSVGTRDPATGTAIRDGGIIPAIAAAPDGSLWVAWQDSRFSGGIRDGIVVSRSTDGGLSWSAPVLASNSGNAAAFTPTLHVREDGLMGLMYFDLRPDTLDTGTLLAATWLATTRDGSSWAETVVWNPFDMAQAPNARGLFLGDYMGLVSTGSQFQPLLALSGSDLGNRTDVYLLRVTPAAAAAAASGRARAAALPMAWDEADFQRRRSAQTLQQMERRVPGWGARVGLR